jgi:hypothetical protein
MSLWAWCWGEAGKTVAIGKIVKFPKLEGSSQN